MYRWNDWWIKSTSVEEERQRPTACADKVLPEHDVVDLSVIHESIFLGTIA